MKRRDDDFAGITGPACSRPIDVEARYGVGAFGAGLFRARRRLSRSKPIHRLFDCRLAGQLDCRTDFDRDYTTDVHQIGSELAVILLKRAVSTATAS
jgi:hypothetical protein